MAKFHFASADAMHALFNLALRLESPVMERDAREIISHLRQEQNQNQLAAFVLSAPNFTLPWTETQRLFVAECFHIFLQKDRPNFRLVLEGVFTQSPEWTFNQCYAIFVQDPLKTELIYACAREMDWTDQFLRNWSNPLALDMA